MEIVLEGFFNFQMVLKSTSVYNKTQLEMDLEICYHCDSAWYNVDFLIGNCI